MRLNRLLFILTAFYITFIGGSTYYNLVPPIRVLHHGLMTLILVLWLVNRLRRGQGVPVTPLNIPIIAAILVWFLSAFASLDPRVAVENLWLPITHTVIFFILVDMFQRGRQKLVMETVFILSALVILITGLEVASWYFGLGILPGTQLGWVTVSLIPPTLPRVALALNVSTWLGAFVAPFVTIAAVWALTVRRPGERRILWVIAGCLLIVLVLSFSRGGWLSLAGAVSTVILFRFIQSPRFSGTLPMRLAIAGAVVGAIGLVAVLSVFTVSGDRQSGDDVRLDLWRSAIDMTVDYPILGVGPGLFGRAWRSYRDPYFARDHLAASHNAYLNTSSETGLVGVVVSLWMGVVLIVTWWRNWQAAESSPRKLRLEAAIGALIGLGIHSIVDVFTPTPVVLPILGLAAYCITGHRTAIDPIPPQSRTEKMMGFGLTLVVLAYGLWFLLRVDPAHLSSYNAMRAPDLTTALEGAENAHNLDPALVLYDLQIAYLRGIDADLTNDPAKVEIAIAAYENALQREPTWDGGWINLAALHVQKSEVNDAVELLDRARHINPLTSPAALHWARLTEENNLGDEEKITTAYYQVILNEFGQDRLPVELFWWATPLREAALERFLLDDRPRDVRYRILSVYRPKTAELLVPVDPQTATDWWVIGQNALITENDPQRAVEAFTKAISLSPRQGDLYASRARAAALLNLDSVQHDIDRARLFGVQYERIDNTVGALGSIDVNPGLTSALYSGRVLAFGLLPEMRLPY